jgi:cell division septation protein DedD
MKRWRLAAALFLAIAGSAAAQTAKVEAVQYPAWLERGGHTVPLAPGIALESHDRLRTGPNARVVVRMGEGSTVKLGENARFEIQRIENRGIFRAALQVLSGAFRFTTEALARRQHRDITIKVTNITAGIRGTDVWGKSTDERDLVCLLEGKVSVRADGGPDVTLDKPLDFYQKPRGGEPALARVDPKQVEIWSAETEIAAGAPAARVGGGWRVVASKFERRDPALALSRRLRGSGYPAQVIDEGSGIFVVQVPGLAGEAEARALMAQVRGVPGVTIPSVGPVGAGAR